MKRLYNWFASPENSLKFHGIASIVWLVASFPVAIFLANSLPFVVFISVYAVVIAHVSSWQAVRTEIKQQKADAELREIVERLREMVERLRKLDPDHPKDDKIEEWQKRIN